MKKEIIYKVEYDLNNKIQSQIEWADNFLRNFQIGDIELKVGQIVLYKEFSKYLNIFLGLRYGIVLDKEIGDQNNVIICPLEIETVDRIYPNGVDIGRIYEIANDNTCLAMVSNIKKISYMDITNDGEILNKKIYLPDESVKIIVDIYRKFMLKICGKYINTKKINYS